MTARKKTLVSSRRVGEVPLDELVHHAEADAGGERDAGATQSGDHGRGERREEQRGADRRPRTGCRCWAP